MSAIGSLQSLVLLVLGLLALGVELFAFGEALRARPDAYVAAGKRTKGFWLAITGLGLAVGFVTFFNVLGLFGLLGVVAAGVFLADVRPALQQVQGRGGTAGPYGPW